MKCFGVGVKTGGKVILVLSFGFDDGGGRNFIFCCAGDAVAFVVGEEIGSSFGKMQRHPKRTFFDLL